MSRQFRYCDAFIRAFHKVFVGGVVPDHGRIRRGQEASMESLTFCSVPDKRYFRSESRRYYDPGDYITIVSLETLEHLCER